MEVFSDSESIYGDDKEAKRGLMFLECNKSISRFKTNDFIVTSIYGYDNFTYKTNKHIRIVDNKATLINKNIGNYFRTNNENIVITCHNYSKDYRLYNVLKGEYVGEAYSEIMAIDKNADVFAVQYQINSLKDNEKDELAIIDDLYFQIDENGNIISKILSSRKVEYLNYDNMSIDKYLETYKKELILEMQKLKSKVYSLGYSKK